MLRVSLRILYDNTIHRGDSMGATVLERPSIEQLKTAYQYLLTVGVPKKDADIILKNTIANTTIAWSGLSALVATRVLFRALVQQYCQVYRPNKMNTQQNVTLCALNPIHTHVLALKYVMNLPYPEIAEILSLDENQVREFMYQARAEYKASCNNKPTSLNR